MPTLVISNLDPATDTEIYESREAGCWNVSRALRDAQAGRFGPPEAFPVFEVYDANAAVEVNPFKVMALRQLASRRHARPGLAVIDGGKLWLIDGHHRLRACAAEGDAVMQFWIIPEEQADHYRVLYNGERVPPWEIGHG